MKGSDYPTDCTTCRLIGGFGLLGIGIYVNIQARHSSNIFSRRIIQALGIGFCGIGVARLFDLYPFNKEKSNEK